MAISAALTPEAARSVLVLGFNHEAEMHHPTKFQQNQAVLGSFIDDSTIISVLGAILQHVVLSVVQTKLNHIWGGLAFFRREIFSANGGSSTFSITV